MSFGEAKLMFFQWHSVSVKDNSQLSYSCLIFRDRLEDMRFMYDTAAESNTKISFDAVDPFYDALPWFRLIGRYASFFTLATDQAK